MSRHRYACRVRFSDVDVYGHVNNVKYFEYYQESRLAFMNALGRDQDEQRLGLVVARLEVDYKRPILFRPEPYAIETWVSRLGTSSFALASEIRDGEQDAAPLLSSARAVMVGFDLAAQRSRPLEEKERARLSTALEPD